MTAISIVPAVGARFEQAPALTHSETPEVFSGALLDFLVPGLGHFVEALERLEDIHAPALRAQEQFRLFTPEMAKKAMAGFKWGL